jgi:hypothetical protein
VRPRPDAKYTHLKAGHERRLLFRALCGKVVRHSNIATPDEASCPRCLIELLIHTLPRVTSD